MVFRADTFCADYVTGIRGAVDGWRQAPIDCELRHFGDCRPLWRVAVRMERTSVIQTAQRCRPVVRPGTAQCLRMRPADPQNLEVSVTIQNQTLARALASIERRRIATGLVAAGDPVPLQKHDNPNSQPLISRVKTKKPLETTLTARRDAESRQHPANGHFCRLLKLPKRRLCRDRSALGLTAGVTAYG